LLVASLDVNGGEKALAQSFGTFSLDVEFAVLRVPVGAAKR
jgi:hypothetical protein